MYTDLRWCEIWLLSSNYGWVPNDVHTGWHEDTVRDPQLWTYFIHNFTLIIRSMYLNYTRHILFQAWMVYCGSHMDTFARPHQQCRIDSASSGRCVRLHGRPWKATLVFARPLAQNYQPERFRFVGSEQLWSYKWLFSLLHSCFQASAFIGVVIIGIGLTNHQKQCWSVDGVLIVSCCGCFCILFWVVCIYWFAFLFCPLFWSLNDCAAIHVSKVLGYSIREIVQSVAKTLCRVMKVSFTTWFVIIQ